MSPTGAIAPLQGEQTSAKDYNKEQGLAKAYVLKNNVSLETTAQNMVPLKNRVWLKHIAQSRMLLEK